MYYFKLQKFKFKQLIDYTSVWQKLFLPTYFTIQLIFIIIYESHSTFWYYL